MSLSAFARVDRFRLLSPAARCAFYTRLAPGALADLRHDWPGFWARPDQTFTVADLEQHGLIVITGPRGEGKTRTAVELFIREVDEGRAARPRIFASTEADVDKAVVHGASGIMSCLSPEQRRRWRWVPDKGPAGSIRVTNKLGAEVDVLCFTAKAPEGAVSHTGDLDFYDDLAKWGAHAATAWTHARLSCREGYACGIVATTRRGTHLLRKLLAGKLDGVLVRRLAPGSNAGNLAAKWRAQMRGELGDVAGSMLLEELDDEDTSTSSPFVGIFDLPTLHVPELRRDDFEEIIVAADESGGKGGDHDDWGIIAAGRRQDGHVVALEDGSGQLDDAEAGERTLALAERWGATKIVVEINRGEQRMQTIIQAAWLRRRHAFTPPACGSQAPLPEIVGVKAKDLKRLRAGELRPLYLAGLLHHGPGLAALERQQREWDPDAPPRPRQDDRIDAWVHAVHHLARLAQRGDAWGVTPAATPPAAPPEDPYRYQAPPVGDGWSVPNPYSYATDAPDPLRYY